MTKTKNEYPETRVYPDPRYVYQPVLVLGFHRRRGGAAIQMVIVECTKSQARKKIPARAAVCTMGAAIGVAPLITVLPNEKLYQRHRFDGMIRSKDSSDVDRYFISIVGKDDFSEIEKYDLVPVGVLDLWWCAKVTRVDEDKKLGFRALCK